MRWSHAQTVTGLTPLFFWPPCMIRLSYSVWANRSGFVPQNAPFINGNQFYMVRFKGYSDAYNVWRPATAAKGCAAHTTSYHQLFNIPIPPPEDEGDWGGG